MKFGKDAYVYALMDGRKPGPFWYGHFKFASEPFYIGKGVKSRLNAHVKYALYPHTKASPKVNKIRKIIRSGFKVEMRYVKKRLSDKEALDLEVRLIKKIGRYPIGPLVNLTDGGEGMRGYIIPKSTTKKRKASIKRSWVTRSPEARRASLSNLLDHPRWQDDAKRIPEIARKISDSLKETYRSKSRRLLIVENQRRQAAIREYHANRSAAEKRKVSERIRKAWIVRKENQN